MAKNLYEVLDVPRDVQPDATKKAYFKLARENHPDKGGNAEKFKIIQHAYEVLSDPRRKEIYDMTGNDGDDASNSIPPFEAMMRGFSGGGGGFSVDIGNVFEQMFNAGGGGHSFFGFPGQGQGQGQGEGQKIPKKAKGPNKHHEVGLKLGEFYKGRDIRLVFNQGRFCHACKGEGSTSIVECGGCGGRGFLIQNVQIHPGMFVQTRSTCRDCEGRCRKAGPVCTVCSGNKILTREKILEVRITPGMCEGKQLIFGSECSDAPEFEKPGDVILILRRADESPYVWVLNDLVADLQISWQESILGFTKILLDHPSGKPVTIAWQGEILLNGARLKTSGLGMPLSSSESGVFGNLVVNISIQQPPAGETNVLLGAILATSKSIIPEGAHVLVRF